MREWLDDALREFRRLKRHAEKAVEQLDDASLFATLDDEANSIAMLMKHMAGNMRSRWTDLFTTDGEKPDRRRDAEFEIDGSATRETVLADWESGWQCLFAALEPLQESDFARPVVIRGERHTLTAAVSRQLTHYAEHVGQIVLLAKHARGPAWRTLSIPKKPRPGEPERTSLHPGE
jgi:hypothetical protein